MARLEPQIRALGWISGRMSVSRVSPERIQRARNRAIRRNPLTDLLFGGIAAGVTYADSQVNGADGPIPIRVYTPKGAEAGSRPLVLYFHGGGWTLGTHEQSGWLCSHIADGVGAVVVSVGYRLAPGHRWPAAPEDCYAALVDLVSRSSEFGADGERVALVGESAGGNLAAVVALMARDRSGPALNCQALLYPATDLTMSSRSIDEHANAPFLSKSDLVAFARYYLSGQDPCHPYVSPLLATDHAGLPRAIIQVAGCDPIRDDGLKYAEALCSAGVPVRVTGYDGMPHGFYSFPHLCRGVSRAFSALCAELRSALTLCE